MKCPLYCSPSTLFWDTQADGTVPPPHMIVVPLAQYDQSENKFETPQTCSKDKLLPKGHQYCRAEEYHLGEIYTYVRICTMSVCTYMCILFILM